MEIKQLTSVEALSTYDTWIKTHPQGTLWQSLEWKTYQEALGREVRIYAATESPKGQTTNNNANESGFNVQNILATALVVIDRTAFGLSTWDIPRGPLGESSEAMLTQILVDAKKDKCMTLFFSPISSFPIPNPQSPISQSARHEQPEATRIIDLTKSEEEILGQMKPKGRYNISVAEKHGVRIEHSDDAEAFFKLVKGTSDRDKFTGLPLAHYKAFLKHLPNAFLLLAYPPAPQLPSSPVPPIAGLIGIIWNNTAIYYYGASSYADRALMGPYLLQWEAMRFCKVQGCHSYDLLGVAPPLAAPEHPWAGISGFKEKFGGSVIEYAGERQIVLRKAAKGLLRVKRKLFG